MRLYRCKCKKQKIKGFHKKSIWPSIVLFFMYLVFCFLLVMSFISVFGVYIISSKMDELSDNARHLGRLIEGRMQEEDILDAVSYVSGYLRQENDICVTDGDYHVLLHLGETELPDFHEAGEMRIYEDFSDDEKSSIIPSMEDQVLNNESAFIISIDELWELAMKAPPGKGPEAQGKWLNEIIYSIDYWKAIPVNAQGYHVYYKDSLILMRKDVIYILAVGAIAVIVLMVPVILLFINVLSSIAMQKRMIKLLYLDTITGGKNWVYFVQRCKKIFCRIRNARNTYAMINLHMDRYQDYCACYGNKAGEELLENINGFLQAKTGREETFARFAKADFGLLLKCEGTKQCEQRMKKMLAELTGIKRERRLNYHVGIYMIPPVTNQKDSGLQQRRQIDVDQIYHYATAASENLHGKEGQFIQVFDHQILEEQLWKRKVEDTMEPALLNKEFHIYLQPKYSPLSGKIVGAEALVRWISPTEGLIAPGRFIPIFEENGFITRLDDYMISAVAKLQSEWKLQGKKSIPVSVNVSRANFTKPDLAQHICHLVDSYGADHAVIELEVTESAFFGDKDMLQKIIKELKMYGFHISMDDFGAGYSSLNSLKDLPIDVLKLDMEFFRSKGDETERRGEIVVKETIQLAKNLDMKIVAEGIERREQVDFLAEQGCDMIQGFYYAKPMPVSEFNERVEKES